MSSLKISGSLDFSHHVRGFVRRRNQANKNYNRLKLVIASLHRSMVLPTVDFNGRTRISDLRAGNPNLLTEEEELQAVQYAQELDNGTEKDRAMSTEGETEVLQAWDALAALPIAAGVGVLMKKLIKIKRFRDALFEILGAVFCRFCNLEKIEGAITHANNEQERAEKKRLYDLRREEDEKEQAEVKENNALRIKKIEEKFNQKTEELESAKQKLQAEMKAETEELNRSHELQLKSIRKDIEYATAEEKVNNQRKAAKEFEDYITNEKWKSAASVRDQVQLLQQFKVRATAAELNTGDQNKFRNPYITKFVETLYDCNFITKDDFGTVQRTGYLPFIVDSYMSLCNARLALGILDGVSYEKLDQEIFKKAQEMHEKINSKDLQILELRNYFNSHQMDVTQ